MKFPERGISRDQVVATMEKYRRTDGDAKNARLFSLVYATPPEVTEVAKDAYTRFFSENASIRWRSRASVASSPKCSR